MRVIVHTHVRRLYGHDKLVISEILDVPDHARSALSKSVCSDTAVFLDKILLQGSRVHSHADRDIVLSRLVDNSFHPVCASDVSRIDPDFVRTRIDSGERKLIVEMNVCYKRDGCQFLCASKRLRSLHVGDRAPYYLAAGISELVYLPYKRSCVPCIHICHRLYRYRRAASDGNVAAINHFRHRFSFSQKDSLHRS